MEGKSNKCPSCGSALKPNLVAQVISEKENREHGHESSNEYICVNPDCQKIWVKGERTNKLYSLKEWYNKKV